MGDLTLTKLTLKMKHRDGKETSVSDLDQLEAACGGEINCVFVLGKDGNMSILDVEGKELTGKDGNAHPGEPGPPMVDYQIKASQVTTAIGPEGFKIRINDTEYVCDSSSS